MAQTPNQIVLVVAEDPQERERIGAALRPRFRTRELGHDALTKRAPLVDAPAVVARLSDALDPEAAVEALLPILELPAANALVLLTGAGDPGALASAVARLSPAALLPADIPAGFLLHALEARLPGRSAGEGGRGQQRPARALLGVSGAIREVLDELKRAAPTNIAVLIRGETGTGKELVARAIHEQSGRAAQAFVAINCSALPDTLLEGELFGYRKGAFTGADRDREGLFEQASGGTLFLDEIGDTSPALQAKLLRAVEAQEIRPLGSNEVRFVDPRIVSATHRDLEAAVEEGGFRQDLLYRINTLTIHLPPLRRRRVDIPFLAQHFAEELGEAEARRIVLAEDFLDALSQHDFPGNVRELRNAVERSIALASGDGPVTLEHLQLPGGRGTRREELPPGTLKARIEVVELETIRDALAEHSGNRTRVAEALGLSRVGLRQKMRRLGLDTGSAR